MARAPTPDKRVVSPAVEEVLGALRGYRFRYADEKELQEGLHAALVCHFEGVEREYHLSPADIVDILVGRVGIETKIADTRSRVLEKLDRYTRSEKVDALILASTRARHMSLPSAMNGKRIVCLPLFARSL